jgi:small conductance mechanosensitive channel
MFNGYVIPWGINLLMALIIFIIGRFVASIAVNIIGKLLERAKIDMMLVEFIKSICHAILLLFVVVAALDKLGVNTTSMVALLGAAGLAIGLSLQGSLQNFAAGVMLLVFRPFKAGDFIEASSTSGVVEKINIFTSTLRTGDNKEVIIPNGNIYHGNIINYSAKSTRRIDLVVGVSYSDDIKKVKEVLTDIISKNELVLADPKPTIAVSELANSSVNFVVRPWVNSSDFWPVKFALTEAIKLRFDEENISIPFPQMDVHLQKEI